MCYLPAVLGVTVQVNMPHQDQTNFNLRSYLPAVLGVTVQVNMPHQDQTDFNLCSYSPAVLGVTVQVNMPHQDQTGNLCSVDEHPVLLRSEVASNAAPCGNVRSGKAERHYEKTFLN